MRTFDLLTHHFVHNGRSNLLSLVTVHCGPSSDSCNNAGSPFFMPKTSVAPASVTFYNNDTTSVCKRFPASIIVCMIILLYWQSKYINMCDT